jgi:hypothetical protein
MATDLRTQLQTALADRYTLERELGSGGMATVYRPALLHHGAPREGGDLQQTME